MAHSFSAFQIGKKEREENPGRGEISKAGQKGSAGRSSSSCRVGICLAKNFETWSSLSHRSGDRSGRLQLWHFGLKLSVSSVLV